MDGIGRGGSHCKKESDRMKTSTQVGQFDLLNPLPDEVNWLVIASSLGKLCRFAGHTAGHYSVAEHSVRLAIAVELAGGSEVAVLQAMLHDAHEAYTGDITRPMREAIKAASLDDYLAIEVIESRVSAAIFQKADCSQQFSEIVMQLDDEFSEYERIQFIRPGTFYRDSDFHPATIAAFQSETYWERDDASQRWLGKLTELLTPPCG